MADGHVNKCKECNKDDCRKNRDSKVEYYREYDRNRGSRRTKEDTKKYRENNPKKYKAHGIVARAIRGGKLFPEPCEICGSFGNIHAHHDDYDKPLNVRWLCATCHCLWHKEKGEGKNAF
jgi:hypothetical protein